MLCQNFQIEMLYCHKIRHFITNGHASLFHCGNCENFCYGKYIKKSDEQWYLGKMFVKIAEYFGEYVRLRERTPAKIVSSIDKIETQRRESL